MAEGITVKEDVPVKVGVGVIVGVKVWVGVKVPLKVEVGTGVREGVSVQLDVGVEVVVELEVGVGVQPTNDVVTALEITLPRGRAPFNSAVLTRVRPQLLTVPTAVKAPEAPAARLPKLQVSSCPFTVGAPLAEE